MGSRIYLPKSSGLPVKRLFIYVLNRQNWPDFIIIVFLAVAAGFLSYAGSQLIDPSIFDRSHKNLWFESDLPRIFANMTIRESNHYRTNVHPLFSLVTYPAVVSLKTVFHVNLMMAVRVLISVVAFIWTGALFSLLRLLGCHRFDAALFSLLGMVSAAAVFWFIVPESYSFGSLSILLALNFVVLAQHQLFQPLWYIAIQLLTLSITVTNWIVGILATLVNHSWKRTFKMTIYAFLSVVVLSGVQRLIFPRSRLPLVTRTEGDFILSPASGGPLHVLRSFLSHTMIMPAVTVVERWDKYENRNWTTMITQASAPGSGNIWGVVSVLLWAALLSLGVWSIFSYKKHLKLRLVLGLTLIFELVLHILYGEETFLYSLHFAPLLIIMVALSTLTRFRILALFLAGMLVITAGINNCLQLAEVRQILGNNGLSYNAPNNSPNNQQDNQLGRLIEPMNSVSFVHNIIEKL